MASRRSRLKAVANLPVRRKPLSVQQEPENSKTTDESSGEPNPEIVEKEQQNKAREEEFSERNESEETSSALDDVSVSAQKQEETINADVEVPSIEDSVPKNKPVLCPKIGRRVKPMVSLSALKERSKSGNKIETTDEDQNNKEECVLKDDSKNQEEQVIRLTSEISESNNIQSSVSLSNCEESTPLRNNDEVPAVVLETDASPTFISDKAENIANLDLHNKNTSLMNVCKQTMPVNDGSVTKSVTDLTQKDNSDIMSVKCGLDGTQVGSQLSLQLTPPALKRTSVGGFKPKKPKCNDLARKVADARREFQRKYEKTPPDRSSLRMIDLIFYNPSTNPMESKSKSDKRESSTSEELLNERVDDPDSIDKLSEMNSDDARGEEYGKTAVPQVKIGVNGEIILDEKSLVIETTDAKKGREDLQNSLPVFEDKGTKTCYYKRKTQKSRDWSDIETKRFYKALNTIGTDFSLMQKYFPFRTRLELKNKFKREEKYNRTLIDKALNNPSEFDITQFEKYLENEKQIQAAVTERVLQRKVKVKKPEIKNRVKSSIMGKEVMELEDDALQTQTPSNEDKLALQLREKLKKTNEINLLSERYLNEKESSAAVMAERSGNNSSKLFTNVYINNTDKIRDAFEEIQNVDKDHAEKVSNNATNEGDLTGDFYKAVVNLSASLKNGNGVPERGLKKRQAKPNKSRGEKRGKHGRRAAKNADGPFMNTLDIETYDSKCDSDSSSGESNDNTITSTKTMTEQDFFKLLAANAQNMKESKIKVQITDDISLGKKVEIILDGVPPITLNEI